MKNNIVKNLIIIVSVLMGIFILVSCEIKEKVFNKQKETTETEILYIPEAANQFAVDKETETEEIEETKAHHIYDEKFKLSNDLEIVIGDKQFLTKLNYIYNNIEKFEKSTIVIEGMYGWYKSWDGTFEFPMVYRNGPGCCGDDQYGGFYMVNINQPDYKIDDWIEVYGKPFMYEHTDSEGEVQKFMFLLVEKIKRLPIKERRAEMVND